MPLILDAKPPEIIRPAPLLQVRFGLSYALIDDVCRVAYDHFTLPRDFRQATIAEIRAYLPADLRGMPDWAIEGMLFVPMVGWSAERSVTFITTTSATDQVWNVPATFSPGSNSIEIISAGGTGGGGGAGRRTGPCCCNEECGGDGSGGGGGAYTKKANVALTAGGTATFRLRAGGAGSGVAAACWLNGTSLAGSSVGVQSGSNGGNGGNAGGGGGGGGDGLGGSTTSGKGDTLFAGGNGAAPTGGGAAGPSGAGSGSTAGGGSWTSVPGGVVAAPGPGAGGYSGTGGNYGGAGSGGAGGCGDSGGDGGGAGAPGLIVVTNN